MQGLRLLEPAEPASWLSHEDLLELLVLALQSRGVLMASLVAEERSLWRSYVHTRQAEATIDSAEKHE